MAKKVLTSEQTEVKAIKKQQSSMKWTGVLAFLLALVVTFGVVVIGKSSTSQGEYIDDNVSTNVPGGSVEENTPGGSVDEVTPGGPVDEESSDVAGDGTNAENKEPSAPQRELPADPKEWTKAEIVSYYKKAADNSKQVKSIQKMTMKEVFNVKLDNSAWNFAIDLAMPIIKAALNANSTEFDGITGGYNNLVPSDVKSAKAYKEGKYTIIEMTLVEQKDDAYGDTFKGTVGHGISVVGNIAVVADNFPDWTINFQDAFVELYYKNPVIKVKINEKGVIEKGTWSYIVHVTVKDLQIAKVMLEDASGEIDYVVTTGGGF